MNAIPTLYIGVAAPLVEMARVWMVKMAGDADVRERLARLQHFPRRDINAYAIQFLEDDRTVLTFHTGVSVSEERVRTAVESWLGSPPVLLPTPYMQPITGLDHRRALAELQDGLQGQPVRIVIRIGLTPQQLQRDLVEHRPELVLLNCHGSREGCLWFEDGRARAEVVSGERLLPLLQPRPQVLFLSACHSEGVLRRAKDAAAWDTGAIVYINADTPVEVAACVAFETMFFTTLLRGESAGEAFAAAQQYVANDPDFGDLSVTGADVPPSQKFCLSPHGHDVRLAVSATPVSEPTQPVSTVLYPHKIRRAPERFVGRQREMQQIIDALLPIRAGITPLGGHRRLVILTKEGGIGKTTLALATIDWTHERQCFPGGIFELSCERLASDQAFLTDLLALFGVPHEAQRGDLLALLSAALSQVIAPNRPVLLVLDNLDDLLGQHVALDVRAGVTHILEMVLTSCPTLRILATCRWPVGVADHEFSLEIPPMHEDEARDVFISHLEEPVHRLEAHSTWSQPDSPMRQLIRMSGRHPQSLRLLARQMRRKGLTLATLRDEAHADLLAVLRDPLANDTDQDRLKKVEVSYALSYRHLSDEGKRLFAQLSRFPGGIWCGESPERFLNWQELFGEHWRTIVQNELDYFALLHYDADGDTGTFTMLPPMLEFARKKYAESDQRDWETTWITFWRTQIGNWDQALSGRLPDDIEVPEEQRGLLGTVMQQSAKALFTYTQANWRVVFEHLVPTDGVAAASFLLNLVSFCQLTGQLVLLKNLAHQVVDSLRISKAEEALASCLGTLGNALRDLGERDAARSAYTEALAIRRRLAQQHPAAFEPDVAMTLNNLGIVLRDLGERDAARTAYTEALAI